MNGGRCGRCESELVSRDVWSQLTTAERRAAREAGQRERRVEGFCNGCHAYLKKHDQLPARFRFGAASTNPTRCCTRCGTTGVVAHLSICHDCADVTTDLREVGLWISDLLVPA